MKIDYPAQEKNKVNGLEIALPPNNYLRKHLGVREARMPKPRVAVIDTDRKRSREVCGLLGQFDFPAVPLYSLEDLQEHLEREQVGVLIVDLDTVKADNHFFRNLKKRNPDLHILCISSRPHHPGLEEAMGTHIYACLAKPLDTEELRYWLKSISEI